jgi:hypothetical protein
MVILQLNSNHMNPQSKLLFIIGVFAFTATCYGQQPTDKKPLKHFTANILTVDSILSVSSDLKRQRALFIPLHHLKCDKDRIRFELYKDRSDLKEESTCPIISKTGLSINGNE